MMDDSSRQPDTNTRRFDAEEKTQASPIQSFEVVYLVLSPLSHRSFTINVKDLAVIGREDRNIQVRPDFDLTDYEAQALGVSRRHAILLPDRDGLCLLDLYSLNGTTLNGEKLHPGQKYKLSGGDVVAFGQVVLEIEKVTVTDPGSTDSSTGFLPQTRRFK